MKPKPVREPPATGGEAMGKESVMIRPVQISFRNMEPSEAVEEKIRAEAEDLDTFYDSIVSCRVVVEVPHRRHEHGNIVHLRIDIIVPGGEIVVRHEPGLHGARERAGVEEGTKAFEAQTPHKHLFLAIHDAFDSARRQLQDYARRQRGMVKMHESPPHARVARLFPEDGYGFLETPEGTEVYFHRNSVLDAGFNRLKVGAEVAFVTEEGEKGLQASTVRITG
jgi:cold shock CspA family protein/ribosome-associated translation inhibitor RaiA